MRIRGKLLVLSLALVGLLTNGLWAVDPFAPPVDPVTIYVDDTAPGLNNGTSWFHAYRYLQDALLEAAPNTVIKVARGTYSPDDATGLPSQGRGATFELKNRVEILGGFAGYGLPFPGERMIQQYQTILNGDLDHNDIPLDPNSADHDRQLEEHATRQENSYSVVRSIDNNYTAVLDGFTIKNGNANGPSEWPYDKERGGGIFVLSSHPTIKNCLVTLNAGSDAGGGMSNVASDTKILNCVFTRNYTAGSGAGIFNSDSDSHIVGCEFIMNSTHYDASGGGLYNHYSAPVIDDCLFKGNMSSKAGAIVSDESNGTFKNCLFIGNSASGDGGAAGIWYSETTFINCSFYYNSTWYNGGAIESFYSTTKLDRCTFNGNIADEHGGAIHAYASEPNYTNCIFSGNVAKENGGAISFTDCDAQIINCTLRQNGSIVGRGIACHNIYNNVGSESAIMVHNSILWHDSNNIDVEDGSQVHVLFSNVSGGYPGPGNIAWNPKFANPLGWDQILGTSDDNVRILPGSPCIDAAQNYAVPADITKDRDGSVRFLDDPNTPDTGLGNIFDPIVDMGAYEFGSVDPYQDTNDVDGGNGGGPLPPPNQAPVADAGDDQLVFAWINNTAQVTLDGTGSFDPENAPLNYVWKWTIDSTTYMATDSTPLVLLPIGSHTVTLIVGDGELLSAPDQIIVNVIKPLEANLTMFPGTIQRGNCSQIVYGIITIPQTSLSAIDQTQPMTLYPGNVQATFQYHYMSGPNSVGIMAQFDKDQITSAIPVNSPSVNLTVIGKYLTGQNFAGTDSVAVIDCP
ncbi:MAG: right-handed parallel beta-helix repeat-containing protein [Planctomycetes bacterium]|nr:right-handed parallel beta-helix repeat-containing protein [Planctomycetota bacterium]